MNKRILIIGGVAGGASVAARARRLDAGAEIIMFERGPHVSFSNCSLPYYLSGVVGDSDALLMMSPEKFKKSYDIDARVNSEVTAINRDKKTIEIKNTLTGDIHEEAYDVLVMAPGASPVKPRSIGGIDGKNVYTVRNVADIVHLKDGLEAAGAENTAVIGGGFIGIEVAENLAKAGKKVTVVEAMSQILAPFDYDMVQMLHKELLDNGVSLIVDDGVKTIEEKQITLASGKTVPADAMYGIPNDNRGVIGSCALRVFGLNAAATGLNERNARKAGIPCDSVYVIPGDKVGIMPGSAPMHFKLVFEVPTGRILGAQAIGRGNVDKRVDVIAAMVSMNGTIRDLKNLELCYSPVFGTARDVVNQAALVAENILYGRFRQVPVTQVRSLVEEQAFIVDVREKGEYEAGHLKGSVNIPLSELRERTDEIPKDRPVYLHCRSSQRSYNALMALQGRGYENVVNISGSFLGICLYEYYNDVAMGREKIVTEYNFA